LEPKTKYRETNFFAHALQVLGIVCLFVLSSRGGLQMIPLKPEFAYQVGDSSLASIASNGAYSVLYSSVRGRELKVPELPFTVSDANKEIFNFYKNIKQADTSPLNKKNVVFVLLEGWSAANVSLYNDKETTTPNFDSLAKEAFTSNLMFAEGHRTTEGIFSIFCSYPNPLGKTVAQTQLQDFNYLCLPEILKQHSWTTAFFQGSLKETSGTGSFAQSLGFTKSFGRDDIPNEKYGLNYWGKHDGDIYDFSIAKAKELSQPFLLGINTNSTHDLQIPENWDAKFKQNNKEDKLKSLIHYSDAMLGKFIKEFFDSFPNSIVDLVADHSSHAHGEMLEQFAIPFAIISPDIPKKKINSISSHRDIAPSVAGLLGIPKKDYEHFTGVDLFNNSKSFASLYHSGSYAFAYDDEFYEYSFPSGQLKLSAFKLEGLKKIKLEKQINPLQDFYFGFVQATQQMLFEGKTKDFHSLKNELTCCFDKTTGNIQ
jgi:phosphoglycerol transferase MdoB-like AlkP superfamily enzyme